METLGRIRARGDGDFTVNDFDSMSYLLAVGKVCWELVRPSMRADLQLRIGSLEGSPALASNHTYTQERRFPAPLEACRWCIWKDLQRFTCSCRDSRDNFDSRIQFVSSSSLFASLQWLELTSPFRRNKDLWGPDAYEFKPERWFDMNKRPESPVGVYGNLCVLYFHVCHTCRELRFLGPALPSLGVQGVALGGGSRKSHRVMAGCE